jgi:hypothetical protein
METRTMQTARLEHDLAVPASRPFAMAGPSLLAAVHRRVSTGKEVPSQMYRDPTKALAWRDVKPRAGAWKMQHAPTVAMVAWVVIAWSGAADACSPMTHARSDMAHTGDGCAVYWLPNEIDSVGLTPVTDLGNGYLLQTAFQGNACYGTSHGVLMNCAAGQALVFGPETHDIMADPGTSVFQDVSGKIAAAAAGGQPMTLNEAEAASAEAGLTALLRVNVTDSFNRYGISIPLDCGCRTYYPDLKPGG